MTTTEAPAAPMTAADIHTKADRVEYVRQQLRTCPKWATRALLALHAEQTIEEQVKQHTVNLNGRGFGYNDAEILSSFARQVLAWNAEQVHKYPAPLSPNQMKLLHKRIGKYARQMITLHPVLEIKYPLVPRPKANPTPPAPLLAVG